MKYNINDNVYFTENGEQQQGTIDEVRGNSYIISRGMRQTLVDINRVTGIAPRSKFLGIFEQGGTINDLSTESKSQVDAELINAMTFYRHYPINQDPFHISYNTGKKYGFGVYFLNNPHFYAGSYDNSRVLTIRPKLKTPLVLTYHKQTTPSFEYAGLLLEAKKSGINTKNELSQSLLQSGFDSLVVFEPRGIYLVLLKADESLYEIVSDLGQVEFDAQTIEPTIQLQELITHDYNDLTLPQAQLVVTNFITNSSITLTPNAQNAQHIVDLVGTGYLANIEPKRYTQKYYEIMGNKYELTEKGKQFVTDLNALQANTQPYAVKVDDEFVTVTQNIQDAITINLPTNNNEYETIPISVPDRIVIVQNFFDHTLTLVKNEQTTSNEPLLATIAIVQNNPSYQFISNDVIGSSEYLGDAIQQTLNHYAPQYNSTAFGGTIGGIFVQYNADDEIIHILAFEGQYADLDKPVFEIYKAN